MKCHSNGCEEEAVVRVFWPGKPPVGMCIPCAERAKGISQAMGFFLHIEPARANEEGTEP